MPNVTFADPLPVTAVEDVERVEARIVLTVVGAGAALIVLVAVPLAVYPALIKFFPTTLATLAVPFRLSKALEFAYFAISFTVLLAFSAWGAARLVPSLERRRIDPLLLGLADLAGLMFVVVAAKVVLAHAPGIKDPTRQHWVRPLSWFVLVSIGVLLLANVLALRRERLAGVRLPRPTTAIVGLVLALTFTFMPVGTFRASRGLAAVGLAVAALAVYRGARAWADRHAVAGLAEVVGIAVLIAFTWDLRLARGQSLLQQAHWRTVYLGPANSVLHGGTMLVNTFAQYGPGSTYFLAAFFSVVSIGFGHFWLLSQILDIAAFLLIYAIFRVTGAPKILSLAGTALAVLAGVVANPSDDTLVPERPLRILVPLVVGLLVVVEERRGRRRWSWATAVALAVASIWAVEVFAYALAIVVAVVVCRARLDAGPGRKFRFDRPYLVRVGGTVVVAQLVFAVCTRLAGGGWPNWPQYFEYTRVYASGEGAHPLAPFQPGALLGLFYFASMVALVTVLSARPDFLARRREAAIALAAATGLAVGYFSYFAGESSVTNTYKMAPAAVLLGILWIHLAATTQRRVAATFAGVLAFVGVWAVALGLLAHPTNSLRHVEHTALFASPAATWHDIRFVAGTPAVDPRAPATATFVRRAFPASTHVLVLLPRELTTEVLLRANRVEAIPMSDPYGENFLPSRVAYLQRLVAQLPVGTRFVTSNELIRLSKAAAFDDLDASLLRTVRATYVLRVLERGPFGAELVRMSARRR